MDFVEAQKYVGSHRTEIIETLCNYFNDDTLLFWSDKPDLLAYQKEQWQPFLNMLNTVFKIDLVTTTTLFPAKNEEAFLQYKKQVETASDKELTACRIASAEMKSVLLALLLAKQKISAEEAFNAAFLEELYQNKFWGEDVAALNARQKSKDLLQKVEEYLKK